MRISLRVLRYVVTTAEAGNVTEAARRLHVSQPSVSAAIAQIEEQFGVQVFVRHHARGMTLTSAGQRLVHDARLLLSHARDFEENTRSLGSALQGEITVGSFITLTARFMPGLLTGFALLHPRIQVKMEEGDQQEILDGLLSGRVEIALSYDYALPDEVLGETLAILPPHLIVSHTHPLAGRETVSLREVIDEPFILLDLPHSRDYFARLFASCGLQPRIAFRSRSFEFIRGLVGRGHGYTILNVVPRSTSSYDGSRVAAVPIEDDVTAVGIMRLRLRRHAMRPAVEAFWSYLDRALAAEGLPAAASIAAREVDAVPDRLA
ncbi:LysR family transcriptional regulator [Phreatobacter stygius]|uniref:LysR family transcriptional regulator n=1 Tax=Phreatobacter stygius TaxID=1940610 RepID=A0A4D7B0V8_9HYPH|nr:LysR family transcriptional regulator [Phreatobacter stygius]QCI67309.1 LysR family transcriptional regulator [Phreatobacter stygius]